MTRFPLLVGAAALTFATPAPAKPDKAHGSHPKGTAADNHGKSSDGLVYSGGRNFALDARGSCPPGLAKKGLVPPGFGGAPPGQTKKVIESFGPIVKKPGKPKPGGKGKGKGR